MFSSVNLCRAIHTSYPNDAHIYDHMHICVCVLGLSISHISNTTASRAYALHIHSYGETWIRSELLLALRWVVTYSMFFFLIERQNTHVLNKRCPVGPKAWGKCHFVSQWLITGGFPRPVIPSPIMSSWMAPVPEEYIDLPCKHRFGRKFWNRRNAKFWIHTPQNMYYTRW